MNELIAFKEFPKELKPRERLVEYGAKTLTNHELLAIILRTGTKQYDVLHLALQVLEHFEDMHSLKACRVEELLQLKGIGFAKAVELLAAIEFGTRVGRSTQIKKGTVTSSQWIGNALVDELGGLHQEHVVALYLNTKNEIIQKETVFKGSLNTAVAHPREIFRIAVRCSAARIILAHNHPSGNPEPSQADYNFTQRMIEAGELLGIELLDHIVVGENKYISIREKGFF